VCGTGRDLSFSSAFRLYKYITSLVLVTSVLCVSCIVESETEHGQCTSFPTPLKKKSKVFDGNSLLSYKKIAFIWLYLCCKSTINSKKSSLLSN